ncbi:MAG: hypothetical protein R3F20_17645 [Planctomycetota bacterium]
MRFDATKAIIVLLLVGNVGFMAYNAWRTNDLYRGEASQKVDLAHEKAKKLKLYREYLRADLRVVSQGKIVQIDRASVHFAEQAARAGIPITDNGITIPNTPKDRKGNTYIEDSWRIGFDDRKKFFNLSTLADFANRIESTAPGFQIKEFDAGRRSATWGTDEWQPNYITVRRIYRKSANS